MPNPSQEPPVTSKAPNDDSNDMDVLCTFKIKIESQNLGHGCTKDQWPNPIKIKMTNPSQEDQCPPKPKIRKQRTLMFFAP